MRRALSLRTFRRFSVVTAAAWPAASHPSFSLLRREFIAEHGAFAHEFLHASGARVLSVRVADPEKVFCAAFLTPPGDDSGVAHVLEHSVLCGSAAFPSKEPFVTLLASSLQTYLNAMTYGDRTVYPVASPHEGDFRNLVRVYLDAVLRPRLAEWALRQEGWRAEPAADGARVLELSGVVLNEMKGVYANAAALHGMACEAALFPDTCYSRSSGGDPLAITALTQERFEAFHAQNYAPARARFLFWGDDDEAVRLELLHAALSAVPQAAAPAATVHPVSVTRQAPFHTRRTVTLPYPATSADDDGLAGASDASETSSDRLPLVRPDAPLEWAAQAATRSGYDSVSAPPAVNASSAVAGQQPPDDVPLHEQHFVSENWVVDGGAALDPTARMTLGVASYLLLGTRTSVLHKALTDSRLGSAVIGGGYDETGLQPTFSVGLQGVRAENVSRVREVIFRTLSRVAADGFERAAVDAALNSYEFSLREFTSGGGPRGLPLLLDAAGAWLHGREPLDEFRYEAAWAALRANAVATGNRCFSDLVRTTLLENGHAATVHSWPDPEWTSRREAAEAAWLTREAARMSEAEWTSARAAAAVLKEHQSTPDDPEIVARIPMLERRDMECAERPVELASARALGSANAAPRVLVTAQQPTSGIGYVSLSLDASVLPLRLLPLLPLLAWSLTATGAGSRDETALAHAIGSATGGLSASASCADVAGSRELALPALSISGKALRGKGSALSSLMSDVLVSAHLDDRSRIEAYLRDRVSGLESSLVSSGHRFAASALAARLSRAGWIREMWGGLTALRVSRTLLWRIQSGAHGGWAAVLQDLREARALLLAGRPYETILDDAAWAPIVPSLRSMPGVVASVVADDASVAEFDDAAASLFKALPSANVSTCSDPCGLNFSPADADPTGSRLPVWFHPTRLHGDASHAPGADLGLSLTDVLASGAGDAPAFAWGATPDPIDLNIEISASVGFAFSAGVLPNAPPSTPLPPPTTPNCVASPLLARPLTSATAGVITSLLQTGMLWDRIRVQGGAYGAGVGANSATGVATFFSYRDPTPAASLGIFRDAPASVRVPDELALDKAVITEIGGRDAPLAPAARGDKAVGRWFTGGSNAAAQARRDTLLSTSVDDAALFADALDGALGTASDAIVGNARSIEARQSRAGRMSLTLRPLGRRSFSTSASPSATPPARIFLVHKLAGEASAPRARLGGAPQSATAATPKHLLDRLEKLGIEGASSLLPISPLTLRAEGLVVVSDSGPLFNLLSSGPQVLGNALPRFSLSRMSSLAWATDSIIARRYSLQLRGALGKREREALENGTVLVGGVALPPVYFESIEDGADDAPRWHTCSTLASISLLEFALQKWNVRVTRAIRTKFGMYELKGISRGSALEIAPRQRLLRDAEAFAAARVSPLSGRRQTV